MEQHADGHRRFDERCARPQPRHEPRNIGPRDHVSEDQRHSREEKGNHEHHVTIRTQEMPRNRFGRFFLFSCFNVSKTKLSQQNLEVKVVI